MYGNQITELLYEKLLAEFPFEGYVEMASTIGKEVASNILKLLPRGARLLDFGSGPCDKTALFAWLGYDCYACDDLSDNWHLEGDNRELICSFAKRENIKFHLLENGAPPPYKNEFFDGVLLLDVIEHLHNSPKDLLNYLVSIIKPGGLLFIAMPNSVNIKKRILVMMGKTNYGPLEDYYFSKGPWRGHVREYTLAETEQLLKYQGLSIVYSSCVHGLLHISKISKNRYVKAIYKIVTNIFPKWRDTILVIGKKSEDCSLSLAKRTKPCR